MQGYRLVLQGLVFPEPVPLFAAWRLNSEGEATVTARALAEQSLPVTPVLLGDETFGGAELVAAYAAHGGWLLTPRQLSKKRRSWKDDLYAYRKETIELLFQRVIQWFDLKACPVKRVVTQRSVRLSERVALSGHLLEQPPARQTDGSYQRAVDLARWRIAA